MKVVTMQLPDETVSLLDKHVSKLRKKDAKVSKQKVVNEFILTGVKTKKDGTN